MKRTKRYDDGGSTYADSEDSKYDMPAPRESMAEAVELVPAKKQSFKEAFADARKSGSKTFEWEGSKYSTALRGDSAKRSSPERSSPERSSPERTDSLRSASAPTRAAYETPYDRMNRENASKPGLGDVLSRVVRGSAPDKAGEAAVAKRLNERMAGRSRAGMKSGGSVEAFAKGGSVKGWGMARGARKAKIY